MMEIVMIKTLDLKPYKLNAKSHPEEQINKLVKIIKEVGFKVPLLITKDNEIIAGHGRQLAAIKLEITELPCIYVEGLTKEQIKAFRIADNKVAESEWLREQLLKDLMELKESGYKWKIPGIWHYILIKLK